MDEHVFGVRTSDASMLALWGTKRHSWAAPLTLNDGEHGKLLPRDWPQLLPAADGPLHAEHVVGAGRALRCDELRVKVRHVDGNHALGVTQCKQLRQLQIEVDGGAGDRGRGRGRKAGGGKGK